VKKRKNNQAVLIGAVIAALALLAAGGWFLLISPQRAKATSLDKEIAQVQQQIDANRAAAAQVHHVEPIKVADLFRLTKAMPSQADIADVLLELSTMAHQTGIDFRSIQPTASTTVGAYQVIPINVIFDGNFYDLSDFLYRLRNLVDVRNGTLDATGRLFTVDSLSFGEGLRRFPEIQATMTIDAYTYGTSAPATSPPAATPPAGSTSSTDTTSTDTTSSDTTQTSTEPSTSVPASPSGATAAGANP
jgi:type IV pilus assembly PilO-like protein